MAQVRNEEKVVAYVASGTIPANVVVVFSDEDTVILPSAANAGSIAGISLGKPKGGQTASNGDTVNVLVRGVGQVAVAGANVTAGDFVKINDNTGAVRPSNAVTGANDNIVGQATTTATTASGEYVSVEVNKFVLQGA